MFDILKPPCKKHKQEAAISARNQDFGDKMKILKEAMAQYFCYDPK